MGVREGPRGENGGPMMHGPRGSAAGGATRRRAKALERTGSALDHGGVAGFNGCRQCRRPPLMSTCEYRCQHMRAMPRAWTSGCWFRVQGLVFRGFVLFLWTTISRGVRGYGGPV